MDDLDPDAVHDRTSFLNFVSALAANRLASVAVEAETPGSPYGPAAFGWENITIESFLEAAVSWADDTGTDEGHNGLPVEPSWHAFAVFLYCGKIYE